MNPPTDALSTLSPPLRVGERISLRVAADHGFREVIGFVTSLSEESIGVVDRRGAEHLVGRPAVDAARRVAVALGRRPEATPPDLLDALARRAGVAGPCWVGRISTLLAGLTPPAAVPPWGEWCEMGSGRGSGPVRARFEGEWVTLASAPEDVVVDAAWWATRMGARSVQVRGASAPAGFVLLG